MGRKKIYEELLNKAVFAALGAIETYNKTLVPYKQETFAILMTNAWELLLKSKYIYDNENDIRAIYLKKGRKYKRNRSGNIMTIGFKSLLDKMKNAGKIPPNIYNNLIALMEIRDNATHLYISSRLREQIHSIAVATTRNFYLLSKEWFNHEEKIIEQLETAIIHPIPYIPQGENFLREFKNEKLLYQFLKRLSEIQENDPKGYLVSAEIAFNIVKSKKGGNSIPVRISSDDPNALPLELTEEQWREKYPWEFKDLVSGLKGRYRNFKQNQEFYNLKKQIEPDPSKCVPQKACYNEYCRIRFLNPQNPYKSSSKKFYSKKVVEFFDQYYERRL